jgi:hypothetical protein
MNLNFGRQYFSTGLRYSSIIGRGVGFARLRKLMLNGDRQLLTSGKFGPGAGRHISDCMRGA